ncbi:MAG: ABC transporter substrate-binding protein [Eubacteriaceae bacterium]|nr:ABC transporter substrate-binding protein [Eubacteriaceae bacterium]
MKKRLFASALAIALIIVQTGCQSGGAGNSAGSETIRIGMNFELSGQVATYGSDTVKGIEMAISEINAAGGVNGRTVELVKYDNKSEPAESTSLSAKLMEQDKVIACLGPATSGNFKATIPSAMSSKVPIISASATADVDVTTDAAGNVNDYVFRICFTDSFQGVTMANFASNTLTAQSAVIFKDNSSDYAIGLAKNFRSTFEAKGGTVSAEEAYVAGDTDFRAVLTKLKASTFDVMFVPGYYQEAGLIIAQARELGITQPILGADGFDSPTLAELAGAQALSNVYYSNHYSALDKDQSVQAFITQFSGANGGTPPNAFNALGYDLGNFIADCLKRAAALNGSAVKDAIASTTDFRGVTGSFSMGADHNPVKAVVVIEMQNGEQVNATRAAAQ